MKFLTTTKIILLCGFLAFSTESFAEKSPEIYSQGPSIDIQSIQKFKELKAFAANRNLEVTLQSIELNSKGSEGRYSTMGDANASKGGSCTVTVTVSIAGQEAQVSATAATCSAAMDMVKEGVASLGD